MSVLIRILVVIWLVVIGYIGYFWVMDQVGLSVGEPGVTRHR